jgi:predicted RNase H-like HicB family nuclease
MAQVMMLVHEESGRFGASFPDFPGCTTVAGDLNSLVTNAPEVLAFHVQGLIDEGRPVPPVRSLSEVWADQQFQEDRKDAVYTTSLAVELPGARTVRANITMDEGTLEMIDRAAEAAGETRSAFLVHSAQWRIAATRRLQEMGLTPGPSVKPLLEALEERGSIRKNRDRQSA